MARFLLTLGLAALLTPLLALGATQEQTLPNGLRVIVREDHRAPVVVTQIWYRVGSGYEHGGLTGISHVLEHMMFQGTPRHGPGQFSRLVAREGGEQNAFTSRDYTAYYEELARDRLAVAFRLEADRMQHLTLDPKRLHAGNDGPERVQAVGLLPGQGTEHRHDDGGDQPDHEIDAGRIAPRRIISPPAPGCPESPRKPDRHDDDGDDDDQHQDKGRTHEAQFGSGDGPLGIEQGQMAATAEAQGQRDRSQAMPTDPYRCVPAPARAGHAIIASAAARTSWPKQVDPDMPVIEEEPV